eukprot:1715099-Lingulodinium_polyedra.AAC.1
MRATRNPAACRRSNRAKRATQRTCIKTPAAIERNLTRDSFMPADASPGLSLRCVRDASNFGRA